MFHHLAEGGRGSGLNQLLGDTSLFNIGRKRGMGYYRRARVQVHDNGTDEIALHPD